MFYVFLPHEGSITVICPIHLFIPALYEWFSYFLSYFFLTYLIP